MFTIYSKPGCPYCQYAIALLTVEDLEFELLTLGEDFDRDSFLSMQAGHTTYPLIYKQEDEEKVYIGGYTELVEFLEDEI